MDLFTNTLVIALLVFICTVNCQTHNCVSIPDHPPCVCSIQNKTIDLRILGKRDGTPRFKIPEATDKATYYYNPCYPFTTDDCIDVAGCQEDGGAYRSIGSPDKATFYTDDHGLVSIEYSGGNGGRTMIVNLVCALQLGKLKFNGEIAKNQFSFNLTSICACPGACDLNGPVGPLKDIGENL